MFTPDWVRSQKTLPKSERQIQFVVQVVVVIGER
jgi:hypothetical protein